MNGRVFVASAVTTGNCEEFKAVLRILAEPLLPLIDHIRSSKEYIAQGRCCFERAIEWDRSAPN